MSRKSRRRSRLEAATKTKLPGSFRITAIGSPCTIAAAESEDGKDGAEKLRRFSGVAYTGAPMKPEGWGHPLIVDLDGVEVPSQHRPALRQHDHEQIVGHTDTVTVTPKGIDIEGLFSGEPHHVAKVTHPAGNGFQWQLSIGADPVSTEFLAAGEEAEVNGRTVTGPMTISRVTRLGECSFVPLGADGQTSVSVSASSRRIAMFKAMLKAARTGGSISAARFTDEEIDKMSDDDARTAFKKCMAADEEEVKKKVDADDDEDDDDDDTDTEEKPKAKAKAADDDKDAKAAAAARIKAARKADADEVRRVASIKATCQKYAGVNRVMVNGVEVDLIPHAIEAGWSVNKTELHALKASRPGAGIGGPLVYSTSHPEMSEAVIEAAVFQATRCPLFDDDFYDRGTEQRGAIRAGDKKRIQTELNRRYPEKVMDEAHTIFKGRIGLQQMLTTIARAGGYTGRESISSDTELGAVAGACMRIQADGSSTISIGNVTANVMNKFMMSGYMFTEQAWKEICAIRSVKDFKPTKSINLFGDFEFKDVGISGELDNATLQDQAFANQVKTRGRILTIPRTTIINDDLGALGQVPMLMGRGAGLKLNKTIWMKFMSPGFDDGGTTNFFAATHTLTGGQTGNSNLSSGAGSTLSDTGLTAATLLFNNQIDPKGYPLAGMDAEVLLYPPDLESDALRIMNSENIVMGGLASTSSASKQPSTNVWRGRYRPVKSRYLNKTLVDTVAGVTTTVTGSTANWWLLANPSVLPVIEVAFLNGQEMPTVQQAGPDFQFNIMGITTRAFFDMDANMQNFRGGVKSAGS